MVIACSNDLSLIDNKEKVRMKRKGIPQVVEDSLSIAVPSKVKKCLQACATPVIPP